MSRTNDQDVTDAIVVGAGLTGLACARELTKSGLRVLVLEAGKRVGGVVGTFETNGFLFESGPNTVPASARHVRDAAADLGIDGQLVTSRSEAKRRYLFQSGGLHELPGGPRALLRTPLLSWSAKRRLLSEPFRRWQPRRGVGVEPTFEEFLTERIGREATRTLAGAFVRGVYAAEIDELGSKSAFPRLHAMCSESGGLVRGLAARGRAAQRARQAGAAPLPGPRTSATDLISFGGGFGTLTEAYGRALSAYADYLRVYPMAQQPEVTKLLPTLAATPERVRDAEVAYNRAADAYNGMRPSALRRLTFESLPAHLPLFSFRPTPLRVMSPVAVPGAA